VRVARIIQRLPPASGGKEIHGAELTRALASQGFEQEVFAAVGDEIEGATVRLGPRWPASAPRAALAGFAGWASQSIIRRHMQRRFDAIHAHGDFAEASAAVIAARACGSPAFLTVHADLGAVRYHDWLRRASFDRMHAIWSVSHAAADHMAAVGIRTPVRVMPSGVREAFFAVPQRARREGVVTVGRLAPLKGLENLVAAHDILGDRLDLPWTVVADGKGAYADEIRQQIEVRPKMRCTAERDPRRLAERLAGATVFVLSSVDRGTLREGVPTALLEAIATQTPIVATRSGGVERVVGSAAVLVPPGDPEALADAIERVVAQPQDAADRAQRALSLGAVRSWREVADEVGTSYRSAGRAGTWVSAEAR
jgi:glycogen synthase